MVYTTATLVAPTALPPSLCLTLSLPRHTQLLLSHCCGCRIFVVIVSMFSACVCVLSVCVYCVCVWQHYRYDLQSLALSMTRRVYTKLARNFNLI